MPQLTKVSVLSIRQISQMGFLVSFNKKIQFEAGQIIGIILDNKQPPRLYSICSSPSDDYISILFKVRPKGELTPALSKLKKGDRVWISTNQGKFIYSGEPAWWISTGTGIAPFRSMFLAGYQPLKLIQGARKYEELYFKDEFELIPDYIKCCSNDKGKGVFEGRLTKYIREFDYLPTNINYYLCGSAEMVVEVRNLLIAKKVPFTNIITEIYF